MPAGEAAPVATSPVAPRPHIFRLRVYYEDTDAGGIVYHAHYLNFAERARTELLRACGSQQESLRRQSGVSIVVRRCSIEYRAPARLDDLLEIRTVLGDLRGARARALQSIHLAAEVGAEKAWLARLDLELACIDHRRRPVRWPPLIGAALRHDLATESAKAHGTDLG